jgi:GNAT superfamily N-acetyltransferase
VRPHAFHRYLILLVFYNSGWLNVKECTIKTRILEDLSPAAVTSAIENNIYNLFLLIGKKAKRELYIDKKIKWIMAAPSVWPNYLFDARFEEPEISIEYIKKKVRSGDAPSQWFLGPGSRTESLIKALTKGGFTRIGQWPGMAVEIANINTDFQRPSNLKTEEVSSEDLLDQWEKVICTAMFGGGFMGVELFKCFLDDENIHFYLAFLCEKPVATSMLFTSAGIAGLYLISTLPEHRNRGIGKTITLAPLHTAEKMGFKIGGLFATQLGEMIYGRLGFKKICNFDIYYYEKHFPF